MGLLHAGILGSMKDVQLVALCDQKKFLTKIAKKVFKDNVSIVNSIQGLSELNLDAVYVTTPIPTHCSLIESIYEGKIAQHIFVEKTLTWRDGEAETILRKAKQTAGTNMVGYQKRYSITFRKADSLLKEEAIGTLTGFKAYSYSSDFIETKPEDAAKIFSCRGGVLRDLGSHAISLALWYFGEIQIVSEATASKRESSYGEKVGFSVKTGDIEGEIEASWCKEGYRLPETGLNITGSKGALLVNDDRVEIKYNNGTSKKWFRQDLADTVDFVLWAPEYYREDRHFVNCALNGKRSNPDFDEASKVDKIIKQIMK